MLRMFPASVPVPTWMKMRAPSSYILRSVCQKRTGCVMLEAMRARYSPASSGMGLEVMGE
jgi:hypothetical protein